LGMQSILEGAWNYPNCWPFQWKIGGEHPSFLLTKSGGTIEIWNFQVCVRFGIIFVCAEKCSAAENVCLWRGSQSVGAIQHFVESRILNVCHIP
jgi:hypothetical protein